jgi:site-specific DNA-methyltransferase (adenine-specific)
MKKQRASRNRTITLTKNEIDYYYGKCLSMGDSRGEPSSIIDNVISGDTFEVSCRLPTGFVDLLIVDPPYNLNKCFGNSSFKQMIDDEYALFTESWISKVKHTLKPSATIYVCCDWRSSIVIGSVLEKHFNIKNRITWQREKGRGAKHNWKNSMEDIWFATVHQSDYTFNVDDVKMRRRVLAPYRVGGKPKDWIESSIGNFRDTHPSNFWDDITVPFWSMPENTDHPTQKPEKLIAKLVLASSNIGDVVFDPFLGVGTTAVVAKKLNRRYLGIEREYVYCALAQKRLEMASIDNRIQGYSDGVFWERNTLALQNSVAPSKQGEQDKQMEQLTFGDLESK